MVLYTETMLLRIWDNMPLTEKRKIVNNIKTQKGFVDYKSIFNQIGFKHAFNDKWMKA